MRYLICVILSCALTVTVNSQDAPTPIPDPVPNAIPVEGPISDAIEKRITERIEKKQGEMYGSILSEIAKAREERTGILSEIMQIRAERNGLLARFAEFASNIQTWREENREQRREWQTFTRDFAPLKNLADIIKWLFWLVVASCVLLAMLFVLNIYDRISSILKKVRT